MSLSVLVVAESDSYLKWGVTLLGQIPGTVRAQVVLARSPIRPSPSQRAAALAGTPYAALTPSALSTAQLARRIEEQRPDAVLLACTGPSLHACCEAIGRGRHRPVLIAGIPGIALPARVRAWRFRGAIDLMVVHSRREVAEYERVRLATGASGVVGLATLPFLRDSAGAGPAATATDPRAATGRPRVIFATQGMVPHARRDRVAVLEALVRLAGNRPDLQVVVKTRGLPGEFHTHYEQHHYSRLWDEMVTGGAVPDAGALTFAAGPMARQLDGAAALVTVSSTAVLEAMARDVPVLLIDEFGVDDVQLNAVFAGSGCLGGLDALAAADFRQPEPGWLGENYFHPAADDSWQHLLEKLVDSAVRRELPPVSAGLDPRRDLLRRRRDRFRLTPVGSEVVRAGQRVRARLHRDLGEEVTSVV